MNLFIVKENLVRFISTLPKYCEKIQLRSNIRFCLFTFVQKEKRRILKEINSLLNKRSEIVLIFDLPTQKLRKRILYTEKQMQFSNANTAHVLTNLSIMKIWLEVSRQEMKFCILYFDLNMHARMHVLQIIMLNMMPCNKKIINDFNCLKYTEKYQPRLIRPRFDISSRYPHSRSVTN